MDPKRLPFFGATHQHAGLFFDASIRFVDYQNGNNPHDVPEKLSMECRMINGRCSRPPSPKSPALA